MKNYRIQLRVTEEFKKVVDDFAKRNGISSAKFIRVAVLDAINKHNNNVSSPCSLPYRLMLKEL